MALGRPPRGGRKNRRSPVGETPSIPDSIRLDRAPPPSGPRHSSLPRPWPIPPSTATMPRVKTNCRNSGPLSTARPFSAPEKYTPDRSEALRVARPEAVGLARAKPSAQVREFGPVEPPSVRAFPGLDAGDAPASSSRVPRDGPRCLPIGRSIHHPALRCQGPRGTVRCCTTRHHKTHQLYHCKVLYPWHPLCGKGLVVRQETRRAGLVVLHCIEDNNPRLESFEIPKWMVNGAICSTLRLTPTPDFRSKTVI